ncbi:unnamed protein product [Pelagomonas calceolata]|uniref:Uncharacterized protein n=1 Tax=Pelagomonas calceolata TaxID=35677 RepID=A0A8J2WTE2_9STRA|nr:unnamed protein product [Pelagomonas calceolata]
MAWGGAHFLVLGVTRVADSRVDSSLADAGRVFHNSILPKHNRLGNAWDYMRVFAKKGDDGTAASRIAADLAKALAPAGGDKVATADLWDEHFEKVYLLADAVMDRVVAEA